MSIRTILLLILCLSVLPVFSCLFQNDPAKPNIPPFITNFDPRSDTLTYETPDSVVLRVEAEDPDGDKLYYRFLIGDSLIANSKNAVFRAIKGDTFDVAAQVRDGGGVLVTHRWVIIVIDTHNEPPSIKSKFPENDSIACAIGMPLEFKITEVVDEVPTSLSYKFILKGPECAKSSNPSSNRFEHWFGINGSYELTASVWDGMYGDTVSWAINVTGEPDTIPPSAIRDIEGWSGEDPGEIELEWIAPGDDSMSGRATGYKIRTATFPIRTEKDWGEAFRKEVQIDPAPAGSIERVVLEGFNPGTWIYVSIRAYDEYYYENDENAKLSPIGDYVLVLVRGYDARGTVINLLSGEGMEGIFVSADGMIDTSDAAGDYYLKDVPYYATVIKGFDEKDYDEVGDFYDFISEIPNKNINMDIYMIPVKGLVNLENPSHYNYGDLLTFVKSMARLYNGTYIFKWWNHGIPITVYNPYIEFEGHEDINLQSIAREAFNSWEDSTGIDLFEEIDDPMYADVEIVYLHEDPKEYNHHMDFTYNPDGTVDKAEVIINLDYTAIAMWSSARMVFAHEFGHVLGLKHSSDTGHLMVGLTKPRVDHPTTDEKNLIKILYEIPFGYDLGRFRRK